MALPRHAVGIAQGFLACGGDALRLTSLLSVCAAASGRRLRRRLTHAPPADPSARPAPKEDFTAPPELVPGVLMAWDFCSTYR